ncbi:MAG TPA: hypothetical protein VGN83_17675 [Falsiroseomonas sp.]|jgi:hypothetical protein|nr:hypothetical protein [Falsiroseomonas sp.]
MRPGFDENDWPAFTCFNASPFLRGTCWDMSPQAEREHARLVVHHSQRALVEACAALEQLKQGVAELLAEAEAVVVRAEIAKTAAELAQQRAGQPNDAPGPATPPGPGAAAATPSAVSPAACPLG